tara:strand:- start:328 stop:459 length:132 start_codon:yes stop_codon:yes gene_type:complete
MNKREMIVYENSPFDTKALGQKLPFYEKRYAKKISFEKLDQTK